MATISWAYQSGAEATALYTAPISGGGANTFSMRSAASASAGGGGGGGGGDIVTAGLLFHIDAGNASSYPGSGTTMTDLAGSGITTTLYGGPTYNSANGGYISFVPSSSQYAQTSASLSVLTTWSIELWHNYNGTTTGGQPCILSEVFANGAINFFMGTLNGATPPELQVGFFNNAWNITTPITLPSNGWYHLIGTYDGSNVKLYVNNVLTQTYATSGTPTSGEGGIRFMRRWDNPDYWGGGLAIVRIYTGALTTGQIATNYNASISRFGGGVDTAGLLFHVDAGNSYSYSGSGSTWTDLAGSGITMTLYNSPTYSSANGGYISFVVASSQYAQSSAGLPLLTNWTIEVWHYYTNTNGGGGGPSLVTDMYSGNLNFVLGGCDSGLQGTLAASMYLDGTGWFRTTSYSLPAVGWYHIVGTYDGAFRKLYVNGVLITSDATTITPVADGTGFRFMRRWDTAEYWGGYLATVRIYSQALTAGQIATNYNASKTRFGLT